MNSGDLTFCQHLGSGQVAQSISCQVVAMVAHLTDADKDLIDSVTRPGKNGKAGVTMALQKVNASRLKRGEDVVTRSPVYRYVNGMTHQRSADESRGRHKILKRADIQRLMQARRRLIKAADSEERITYNDIIDEAGYDESYCSKRTFEEAFRAEGVAFRAPRRKIALVFVFLSFHN